MVIGDSQQTINILCKSADEFKHLLSDDPRKSYVMGVLDQIYSSGLAGSDEYNELYEKLALYTFE